MSWQAGVLVAVLLVIINKFWAPWILKKLEFRSGADKTLAEPGELITWTGTVENRGKLPARFVRVRQTFPDVSHPAAEESWIRSHCTHGMNYWTAEERIAVRGRKSITRTMDIRFDRRGQYTLGEYRLTAGDLLGIGEAELSAGGSSIVIIPDRAKNAEALQAVGGFLGDISVRRFILEDPVLTMGFRDYTGREPMKAISWTRTAATGTLQVKQFDHTAEQTVMILLDVEGGTEAQIEACFRLMRTVCETLERQKIPFGMRTNGNLPGPVGKLFWMAEGLGIQHLNTILYALGRADHFCFYSLRYLVNQTLQHRKNNESYIIITPAEGEGQRALLRRLKSAAGNAICVLSGDREAQT